MHNLIRNLAAAWWLATLAANAACGQCVVGPDHGPTCPCNPYEDNNGPLLQGDPLLDNPLVAPLGWFGSLEADLAGTHIKNRLVNQVTVNGTTDMLHLPTAELDWTVSPRIEVGYRFGEGAGELLLAYKFLLTSGNATLPNFDTAGDAGNLHSRLNTNAWDLDYGSHEYGLLPCCDMKWRAGIRLASVFFDSMATSPLLEQRVANNFVGAGPHVGLDLRRCDKRSGLELFGRLENAFLIGQTAQSYEEVFSGGPGGASRLDQTLVVPWLGVAAGLGWTPPGNDHWHFAAGYAFETWWSLADVADARGQVTNQGIFLRCEIRY